MKWFNLFAGGCRYEQIESAGKLYSYCKSNDFFTFIQFVVLGGCKSLSKLLLKIMEQSVKAGFDLTS